MDCVCELEQIVLLVVEGDIHYVWTLLLDGKIENEIGMLVGR